MAMSIIWQGNASADFGLLLTEMPTVTYPGQRYDELYVDGRSDAIITKKGFEAFDMTVNFVAKNRRFNGETWANLRDYGDFLYKPARMEDFGKLILPWELLRYYEAELLNQTEFVDDYHRKRVAVTFRVQPLKRFLTYDAYDKPVYLTPVFVNGTTGTSESFTGAACPAGKKPKIYVACRTANDTDGILSVAFEGSSYGEYIGRRMTFSLGQIKTNLNLTRPVLCLDFENDTYYAVNDPGTYSINATNVFMFAEKYSAGSILPYLTNTPWTTVDAWQDVEKGTTGTTDLKYWHDIKLNGSQVDVEIRGADSHGVEFNPAVSFTMAYLDNERLL